MLTMRISAVPAPMDDEHLVQVLTGVCSGFSADIELKRIALLGDDGRTYRLIVAQGRLEFASLLDALSILRFAPSSDLVGVDAVLQRARDD